MPAKALTLVSQFLCKREKIAVFLRNLQITVVIFCKFERSIVVLSGQLDKGHSHVLPVSAYLLIKIIKIINVSPHQAHVMTGMYSTSVLS